MTGGRLIISNSDPVYEQPGVPAGNATLVVYQAGTTNPANIYADSDLTTPIENPQVSLQDGTFYSQSTSIWADIANAYDVVLSTSTGQLWSYENISLLGEAANNSGYLSNPSPQLTGSPTSTTPSANDSSSKIATTAFVAAAIAALPGPPAASATTPFKSNVKGIATGSGGTVGTWSLDKAIMTTASPAVSVTSVTGSVNLSTIGLNGIDSGTVTGNTFYWVYCITDGTTPGFVASTSPTAPALPSGYTYYILVGVMKTDGGATIVPFVMYDQDFDYLTQAQQQVCSGGTGGSWQSFSIAAYVPASFVSRYRGTCFTFNNTVTSGVAPINPGQPVGAGTLPGTKGYAWSLGGSGGAQTYQGSPYDFPYASSSLWYIAIGSTCAAYITGFRCNL